MVDEQYFVEDVLVAWRFPMHEHNLLLVFALPYQENCINQEWAIIQQEKENEDIDKLRIAMFNSGYWWDVTLPYKVHPDGGLVVIHSLLLDWEITFEQPWDYPIHGYNPLPAARESFCPPVPISAQPHWVKEGRYHLEPDGFEHDSWLMWPWDLEEEDE
ncbi:hypothetical protein [Nodularia sp. NIES-3585]|uniref:hypothetical protein n=1 Tax=Nodularia sp. NIES-3585 TaxID=1973477 RepID=UPI000B5C269D|nr:hypothetical protein [Nodularia sp. NIES-3585]GAX37875.1 hypothetical protein NIES3585_39200 [Nodularia sp. NIES-3585]